MRIAFLLLFLLNSSASLAQVKTSYYPYLKRPILLSDRSFNVYIIPQLRAISQEYFHLLRKLNPVHSETINLYKKVLSLARKMEGINQICQESNNRCEEVFKKAYKITRSLDKDVNTLQSKYIKVEYPPELDFVSSLDKMSLQIYILLHKIEENLLTLKTSFTSYYFGKSEFQPLIHRMLLDSEFMLTQMLEGSLKDVFDSVWTGDINEINQHLIYQKDKIFLLKRLEELNLTWNTFHMKMTKGNYNIPTPLIKLIKVMHNRWNSILKVILR